MNNNTQVHSMTESGLLTAITVITALIAMYVPVLGTVATLLWPLPIIVLVVRHGLKWGIMSITVAMIIMAALIEPMTSLRMVISFGPPALVLGYGFRHDFQAAKNLLYALISSMGAMLAAMGLLFATTGINPFDMQIDALKESMDASMSAYEALGLKEADLAASKRAFDDAFKLVGMLMPLVIILTGALIAWINFAVGGKILRRLGHPVTSLPVFDDWHLPKGFIYLFGFSLIGMYWGNSRGITELFQISLNANLLATLAGFLQGTSLLRAVANHLHMGGFVFWILIVFIFINGLFAQLLAFIGLFDIIFDYRKRITWFTKKN